MSSKNLQNPKPDDQVCYNCKWIGWHIAIGQGLRCALRERQLIPSRYYTCEKFEFQNEKISLVNSVNYNSFVHSNKLMGAIHV